MAFFNKKKDENLEEELFDELSDEELLNEGYRIKETKPVVEETIEEATETINLETLSDVTESKEETDEEEWDEDEEEYEYVTPHYGVTAFLIAFFAALIGGVMMFLLMGNNIKAEVREAYLQDGYIFTKDAMAQAEDIALGKTAYVNGQLVVGTYEEIDTSNATAKATDILAGYTAYVNGELVTGTIPSFVPLNSYTPADKDIKIVKGYYIDKDFFQVDGSANLDSANIKKGVKIFGVTGTYEGN